MAQRRKYSDQEKAGALAVLDANSGDVRKTARILGIPYTTLREWCITGPHNDVAELRKHKKIDLAQRLEQIARELTYALPYKIKAANLQQTATSMAIAIDKMQLLRGQPTSIADIAVAQIADRIERMTDDERSALARQLSADHSGVEAE
ncbi:MAG: transposase [Spirulinaceae cyanobacterium SM2_1_0]|nr:transposase [Spirulinaceae cyanobacterium SM2_1_0]